MIFSPLQKTLDLRVGLAFALLFLSSCSAGYNLQSPFGGGTELTRQVQSHEQALVLLTKAVKQLQDQSVLNKVDK